MPPTGCYSWSISRYHYGKPKLFKKVHIFFHATVYQLVEYPFATPKIPRFFLTLHLTHLRQTLLPLEGHKFECLTLGLGDPKSYATKRPNHVCHSFSQKLKCKNCKHRDFKNHARRCFNQITHSIFINIRIAN